MGFKRTGRFKIQFLGPNSLQMPQIFLHFEIDISRIDECQKFGRKGKWDYIQISSSLATNRDIFEFEAKLS